MLPGLGGTLLDISGFLNQASDCNFSLCGSGTLQFGDTPPNATFCYQPGGMGSIALISGNLIGLTYVSCRKTPSDDRIVFQRLFDGGFNFHCRQNFLSETLRGRLIVNGFAHLREMPDQKLQDPGCDGRVPKQRPPLIPSRSPLRAAVVFSLSRDAPI
jgi:hypothetical protein